jgi:hypothetical protein
LITAGVKNAASCTLKDYKIMFSKTLFLLRHNLEAAINQHLCINSVIDVTAAANSLQLRKLTLVAASLSAVMFLMFCVTNYASTETSHTLCWLI